MSLGLTPLGDRVLITPDIDAHAPQETQSGLVLAQTLAAAIDGSDSADSFCVGTIVAVGPLVTQFEIRPYVKRRLKEIYAKADDITDNWNRVVTAEAVQYLLEDIEQLPTDCPDPLHVGDRVAFSWAAGQQITLDDTRYLIMRASEVLAVLDKD